MINISASMDPQFHIYEIEDGDGKSTNILYEDLIIGW